MNIVIIMSDEHSNEVMGCSGHNIVRTPVLDGLAVRGTRFENCYTSSPLCVPARASMFTGIFTGRLGTWDNGTPYDGSVKGLQDYLCDVNYSLTTCGKLDFHINGKYNNIVSKFPIMRESPDPGSFYRTEYETRPNSEKRFNDIKMLTGEHTDDIITQKAVEYINGRKGYKQPWCLFVGFNNPHFPFHCKPELWDYYNSKVTELPVVAKEPFTALNEPLSWMRSYFKGEYADEETVRRMHVGYYCQVEQLDMNVGLILNALEKQELMEDTLIIYTSDHGEQLGHHGLWWKCCMFEESVHIPLIVSGKGVKAGQIIKENVSLVDVLPTAIEAVSGDCIQRIDGESLWSGCKGEGVKRSRDFVFSEYHGHGSRGAMYMIRWKHWKYVYFTGYKPQLFNLEEDAEENIDLLGGHIYDGMHAEIAEECHNRLLSVFDPEEVNKRALSFQKKVKEQLRLGSYNDAVRQKINYVPYPIYYDKNCEV